jgi:hypothetical protein
MEKYTQFRDKATGISPFMPTTTAQSPLKQALGGVLFVVKLNLLLVISPLLLAPFLNDYIWKLAFFILGAFSWDMHIQGVKRQSQLSQFYPATGELYMVNYTSPLDFLVLRSLCSDFIIAIPNQEGHLRSYNTSQFLLRSMGLNTQGSQFINTKTKPIFIFPEGTTSNGKSLLRFKLDDKEWAPLAKEYKVKTLAIKLIPSNLITTLPIEKAQYIYNVLSTPSIGFKIRIGFVQGDSLQHVRDTFNFNAKLKPVSLGWDDKLEFMKTFKRRR